MSLVFLSHHSADKPGVESLAFALLDRGIRPWFDKWDLTPGRPWIPELEDAL
ncbi:MAG: TIR domain-containing protein, partial [bacterium]|nr:TIR domain-containing protein [bacterium]